MKRRVLALILTVLLISGLPLLSSCQPKTDPVAEQYSILQTQQNNIYRMLNDPDARFINLINLYVTKDDTGNLCFRGELNSSASSLLKDLVDSYNADPSTTIPITQDEVETALTADIVKSTENVIDNKDDSFVAFVLWCQDDADLVYNKNLYDDEGNILHSRGSDANTNKSLSNYAYLLGGDTGCPNFEFSWEYDAQ